MGIVYDQAAEVVVWLGHDSECFAETAFDDVVPALSVVKKGTQHKWSVVPDASFMSASIRNHLSEDIKSPYPVTHLKGSLPSILDVRHTDSIKRFYQLTWFTPMWALQEGDHYVQFSEINVFIHFAITDEDLVKILKQEIKDIIFGSPYCAFWNVWLTYDKKGSWFDTTPVLNVLGNFLKADCTIDFLLVLEASTRFNATNPPNYVFAFLGHPKALKRRQTRAGL
ncbi:heterokaryon incompatibility protein [Colletotrichum chrysophilum]|uniref:Heterokaryon incompatibility protein n=1 Tax=Colletotrichum chrysophilum TaxID=1836956 RepID=A0AAD9EGK1_9PEZI|nr:heterokaryon incompatibility protein [Colletotrichum chrysophilum]